MLKKITSFLISLVVFCVSCGQEKVDPSDIVLTSERFYLIRPYSDPNLITDADTWYYSALETAFQLYKYQNRKFTIKLGVYVNHSWVKKLYVKAIRDGQYPDFNICLKTTNYYGEELASSYLAFDSVSTINGEFERYYLGDFMLFESVFEKHYSQFINGEGYFNFELGFQIKETQEYKTYYEFFSMSPTDYAPVHFPTLHYIQYESGLLNFDIIESRYNY